MTLIYLVRHGRAAAGWDDHVDPELDATGRAQAAGVRDRLASIGPLPIVTSPLRRCRESAAPLAAAWDVAPVVEMGVAEIPSPPGIPMGGRVEWLRIAMRSTWTELGDRYVTYRDAVTATVLGIAASALAAGGAVVFSHFVAINAAIGSAVGDDRVLIRRLDNGSITVVEVRDGALRVVESGREADTQIR